MPPMVTFTVFTKPWKVPLPELARHIAGLGFDGVELPVRPGYPVPPENVTEELPRAARLLADHGLRIASIAGPTDETTIAACAEAGVSVIRICVSIRPNETYFEAETRLQRQFDALVPALDRYGVTLGIQNHCGRDICNAMGLRSLVSPYAPKHIAAVWDAAHNALQGEEPELALDIVEPHLCMVNLKNAFWRRTNGPEAEAAAWRPYWTSGRHGLASWPRVAASLTKRGYNGLVCLTAEYSEENAVDRLVAEDLAFARSLFTE
jgi:sugar phosphate isomerase/epimerase